MSESTIASRMPCSTPIAGTAAATASASQNSPWLSRQMLANPFTSIMPTAMVKTTPASTLRGRYCSGPVSARSTIATMAANTSWANWLLAPALSAIAVWVGLPLTTKAPVSAAPALATAMPRMSAFSSTRS